MNRSNSPSGKSLGIFVFLFFLISFSVYAAIQLPWGGDEKVENGFLVTTGNSKEVTVWSECKKITATTKNVYVPTGTQYEWDQFKTHPGNVGASIAACACIPAGASCDALVPACETTTTGHDSCGTPCTRTGGACSCIPDGSCSAATPACETTTTGLGKCGETCTKTGGACACSVTSCSAPAPACETTTTGIDNCGGSCSKYGGSCGGITCPGGSATVNSPDGSNACSFNWGAGVWNSNTSYSTLSIGGTGEPPGSAGGSCNKYGSWDFTFTCPNKNPGPVTCVGGGYTIASSDGSNVCQFYWPTINAGQSASIDGTGEPPGSAGGSCSSAGAWSYNYSCPNKALPSCGGGGGDFGGCSFMWGSASAGTCASAGGSPSGFISACCGSNGQWGSISVSCP